MATGRRMHVQGPPMIPGGSDDSNPDYYYYNDGMGDSNSDDGDIDNSLSIKYYTVPQLGENNILSMISNLRNLQVYHVQ